MITSVPELLFHVYVERAPHFMKPYDKYNHWCFFLVDEGEFTYRMNGISGKALKGECVVCPPDTFFYRQSSGLSFHFIGFLWRGGDSPSFEDITEEGKLPLIHAQRVQSTFALLREIGPDDSKTAHQVKDHLLKDLWILYVMENGRGAQTEINLVCEDPFLQRAVRMLEQRVSKGPSVKLVAQELGISQVQLIRLFKREFKLTPGEYQHRLRLERVKQLLSRTSLSLAVIAERCGFTDEHHLSKSFKKACGMNPSVYRKSQTF